MFFSFFRYLFIAYLILSCILLQASTPLKMEVSAKAAILIDAQTGDILFEKNAHEPLFPASITKMITALYALEKKGELLQERINVCRDMVAAVYPYVKKAHPDQHPPYRLEFGGSNMGIKVGELLSFEQLLYGLMLVSGNDAANAIASYVSGSIPQFMKELNSYVQAKGCTDTHLYNPHGLPHTEHKTTAFDMALLAKEALKNPILKEIVKTVKYTKEASNLQPEAVLYQHNALLKPGGKFYYPKAIGIKTGYTNVAGYTLVAAAEDSQRRLIAVLLGCEQLDQRYKDAIALFEVAFNEKKLQRALFSKNYDFFSSSVSGGKNTLEAVLEKDLVIEYFGSQEPHFYSKVVWKQATPPIKKGQIVGEVQILTENGQRLATSALFAANDVKCTLIYRFSLKYKQLKEYLLLHLSLVIGLIGIIVLAIAYRKIVK